jgi:chromosome condensin MukBEF ATPase and DNA-binding subunit MukB
MKPTTPEVLNAVAREVRNLKGDENQYIPAHSGTGTSSATRIGGGFDERLSQEIEQFARAVANPAHAAGRMPPEPRTLRGRAGAALVRLVRRCLFWYTEQINEMFARIGGLLRRISLQLSNLDRERERQRQLVQDLAGEVSRLNQAVKKIRADIAESELRLAEVREALQKAEMPAHAVEEGSTTSSP